MTETVCPNCGTKAHIRIKPAGFGTNTPYAECEFEETAKPEPVATKRPGYRNLKGLVRMNGLVDMIREAREARCAFLVSNEEIKSLYLEICGSIIDEELRCDE